MHRSEVEPIDIHAGESTKFLVKLLAILPDSVAQHFHRNRLYFAEGPDQMVYVVPREGTAYETVREVSEKINAYLRGQPKEFIGIELDTEH